MARKNYEVSRRADGMWNAYLLGQLLPDAYVTKNAALQAISNAAQALIGGIAEMLAVDEGEEMPPDARREESDDE